MIIFDHVSKVYSNGTVGLDDVSLTIQDGEFVAIIGRSGAGKSTLLRSVNRMHQITSGTLTVNGTDVSTLSGKSLRRFRRGIGMVFQSFNLVTRTTVIKNVLSACVPDMPFWRVLLGVFRKEDKIKSLESLDKVGILDKAYMRADQLSGGQQQRVALARTLTQDPRIILADEPVAALDPVTAKQVMQDFVRINQEMGISILLNIHHVELALEYANRIIGIRAGKIVYDGPSGISGPIAILVIFFPDSVCRIEINTDQCRRGRTESFYRRPVPYQIIEGDLTIIADFPSIAAVVSAGRHAQAHHQCQQKTCKLFPIFHVRYSPFIQIFGELCSCSAMDSISSWLSSTLPKRTKIPLVTALFHTCGSASGRKRILSRWGFMSRNRRLPDTKSTCRTYPSIALTATIYFRST